VVRKGGITWTVPKRAANNLALSPQLLLSFSSPQKFFLSRRSSLLLIHNIPQANCSRCLSLATSACSQLFLQTQSVCAPASPFKHATDLHNAGDVVLWHQIAHERRNQSLSHWAMRMSMTHQSSWHEWKGRC
jgi:hypothetical protein